MVSFIKRQVLATLASLGYIVLKRETYADLVSADRPAGKAAPAIETPAPARPPEPTKLPGDPEFRRFCDQLDERLRRSPDRTHALYCLIRDLKAAKVEGDVVDCGSGVPDALAIMGAALAFHGDRGRKLVLLDVSGDPTHRTEPELRLWGGGSDLLAYSGQARQLDKNEAQPMASELRSSGYPPSRVLMLRGVGAISGLEFPVKIAFLKMTDERYPANRMAVTQLIPKVVEGGIVVVEDAIPGQGQPDRVVGLPIDDGIPLNFAPSTETLRVARC